MPSFLLTTEAPLAPTEKLFIRDAYLTECEATVVHVQDDLVLTNQTVFYAEGGGQAPDPGWIDGIPVIDVQKQSGRIIHLERDDIEVPPVSVDTLVVHRLDKPAPFEVGQTVHMRIDWQSRYLHMRNHSASHFLYHTIRTIYGRDGEELKTTGCSITAKNSRFDYTHNIDPASIPEVSALANDLIAQGGNITMEPDENTNEISYWTYGNIIIPCGGTHVRSATEIGPIRLKRSKQGKNSVRVYAFLEEDAQ